IAFLLNLTTKAPPAIACTEFVGKLSCFDNCCAVKVLRYLTIKRNSFALVAAAACKVAAMSVNPTSPFFQSISSFSFAFLTNFDLPNHTLLVNYYNDKEWIDNLN